MIALNDTAIELIRDSKILKKALIKEMGISERTFYNLLASNSTKLTELGSLNIIVEHTNRPLSELVTAPLANKLLGE